MKKSRLRYTLPLIGLLSLAPPHFVFANAEPKLAANHQLQSQTKAGVESLDVNINKSPTDKAIYHAIRLANQMEVLLISDPMANKSLMSVGLPIGSMEDPTQQQGLAHYLEHMILMGSKAFPETNSLDGFLTKNGGYNNAYTAPDRTVYFLEVNNNAFNEAVARLADAFAQPLLSETNAKKEINAVNAEMVRAKSNDGVLMHAVNLATANPAHPMTKFAVGNKFTLSDKAGSKLQDELIKFYQQYYSANIMKAVLYSDQPIEKLATLAESTLGKVDNKHLTPPAVNTPLFRQEDKGVLIHYKPIHPMKLLAISFDLPEDKASFKTKNGRYLSYILSNEGTGTLSDYLLKQGLSDSGIQAEYDPDVSRNHGDFSFYVSLTDKGLAQKDKVISLIFQQIEQIKQDGIQTSYFNELKESLSQDFQHLQSTKSGRYVAHLTSQMLRYPLEHIIDAGYVAEQMDPSAIKAILDLMHLDNARIVLVQPDATTDQKTEHFEAPYAIAKISPEQKQQWLDFSQNPVLQLPELNPYFATDFSLNAVETSRTKPMLLEQQAGKQLYAMPSHYFPNDPKVAVLVGLQITPEVIDLKQSVSADLLGYMADLAMTKLTFQANVAGITFSPTLTENGIGLRIEGYTQNLVPFIQDAIDTLSQFELSEATLSQAKQRYIEALEGKLKENAASQVARPLQNLASYPYVNDDKKRAMVEQIGLADIQFIRTKVLTQGTGLRLLSVGNLSDKQVKALAVAIEKRIKNHNTALDFGRYVEISQHPRKLNYVQSIPHDDNAFMVSYFPKGYTEIAGLSRATLLRSIISRWYFDDLRTDKQLGYVVYATSTQIGKTAGLQFLVQSPTASPQTIMQHHQRFLADSLAKLTTMSQADFEKYRSSLIERLKHKPESLSQEFAEFQRDFIRNNPQFDTLQQTIEQLNQLRLQDIIDFYQQAIIDQTGLVFVSQAIGTNSAINQKVELAGFETVEDIEMLQKSFEVKPYQEQH